MMGSEDTADNARLPEGTVIDGRYRIVGLVEATYTGSVYAAEKISSGEVVAVNFIDRKLLQDEAAITRLRRDLEAVRNARHPNIAELFDWSIPMPDEDGQPYVVMELIVGLPLSETLRKGGKIDLLDALKIILMVLGALSTLHKSFVAHRNLSPQSIILSVRPGEELQVKIVDFGMPVPMPSREIVSEGGKKIARPEAWDYAAPEYHSGGHVVARSDIFACGMMLMRMLTGKIPQPVSKDRPREKDPERAAAGEGDLPSKPRDSAESKEFPAAGTFNPVIPDDIDGVIAYALRKKAVERYAYASEMKEDLEKITARIKSERSVDLPPWQKPDEIIHYLDSLVGKVAPDTALGVDLAIGAHGAVEAEGDDFPVSEEYPGRPKRAARTWLYMAAGLAVLALAAASYVYVMPLLKHAPAGEPGSGRNPETLPLKGEVPQESEPEAGVQEQAPPAEKGPAEEEGEAGVEEVAETVALEPGEEMEPEPAPEETAAGAFEHRPIHVVVYVEPKDAVVKIGNTMLKGDPREADMVARKWPVAIMVEADGYETFTKEIYLRKNRTFTLALNKLEVSAEDSAAKDKKKKKKKKKVKKKSGWLFVD